MSTSIAVETKSSISQRHFPEVPGSSLIRESTTAELLDYMRRANFRLDIETGQLKPYATFRLVSCAAAVELNRRATIAPRFRPLRKPKRFTCVSDDESVMNNDRQVLDLHWLYCRQVKLHTSNLRYRRLFEAPEFDFELAASLVKTTGSYETKIAILALPEALQWELAAIQKKGILDKWRGICSKENAVRNKLIDRSKGNASRAAVIEDRVAFWKCRAICGTSPSEVGHFFSLMTGRDLHPSTVSRKLDGLSRALGEA